MNTDIHPDSVQAVIAGNHGAPFDLLGAHQIDEQHVSIRAFYPYAEKLQLVIDGKHTPMNRLRDEGFFEATVEAQRESLRYQYEIQTYEGQTHVFADPYIFSSQISDFDRHLFNQGQHLDIYEKLGAHFREIDGFKGVQFAVWAPNAYRVSVTGSFNRWDARVHPMLEHIGSGIWEIFIPGVEEGAQYKFDIRSRNSDYHSEKGDPYGFWTELRPRTASVVVNLDSYQWGDADWMEARTKQNPLESPMNAYEVHLGSWQRDPDGRWLSYRELAHELVAYAKKMHYTHLELMPVMEYPYDGSWGYQVTGYYAPTSRYGTPQDFMYFVDHCHQNGIGVILDWVPAHFPKDGFALSYFDGTHLYEHADIRQGEHPDWGTYIFNYGRNEVRNFLLANALFWLKKYHIDGLRVDAVSSMLYLDFSRKAGEWIPNQYGGNENLEAISLLKTFNEVVHREVPGAVTIAEESTAWAMVSRPLYLGGLGFTFKWNMGWMHDTLKYMQTDPVFRRYHHNQLTFSIMYTFSENFVLSLSHDEVVHGKGSLINKMHGDWWQKFASLRLMLGYQITHPGKKLLFMGQEFGQWREWDEARSLDWHLLEWETHIRQQNWVRDLNKLYTEQPALYERDTQPEGYRWIEPNDVEQSVLSYIRYAADPENFLVIAANFTPMPRHNYRIGVPSAGRYRELINSDSEYYGGGNVGNTGDIPTDPIPWHSSEQSLSLTIPPLGMIILKLDRDQEKS